MKLSEMDGREVSKISWKTEEGTFQERIFKTGMENGYLSFEDYPGNTQIWIIAIRKITGNETARYNLSEIESIEWKDKKWPKEK